ncbi:MAG: hypothetical protein QW281_05140 [Saccharolobus sp.]
MERITVEGEIDNYYVFKQRIIAVNELNLTIPNINTQFYLIITHILQYPYFMIIITILPLLKE